MKDYVAVSVYFSAARLELSWRSADERVWPCCIPFRHTDLMNHIYCSCLHAFLVPCSLAMNSSIVAGRVHLLTCYSNCFQGSVARSETSQWEFLGLVHCGCCKRNLWNVESTLIASFLLCQHYISTLLFWGFVAASTLLQTIRNHSSTVNKLSWNLFKCNAMQCKFLLMITANHNLTFSFFVPLYTIKHAT